MTPIYESLPPAALFYMGVVAIFAAWVMAYALLILFPEFLRLTWAWCQETFRSQPSATVVSLADRRRQLDAAAGRKAS